ncbi:hypothetical protein ES332_D07G082900v1 [Gossypium tomentosum]|uniref:Uncharacterized protein n=1 Tax=Gossypium tomentosum TaxID=34277 RepID=A0A5D2K5M9_GOSTO|nr:hypothetical protein ES332_D07G082900v1 [Gossypium tomentosum]
MVVVNSSLCPFNPTSLDLLRANQKPLKRLLRYLGLSFERALSTIIFGCGFDLNEITMVNGVLARGSFACKVMVRFKCQPLRRQLRLKKGDKEKKRKLTSS